MGVAIILLGFLLKILFDFTPSIVLIGFGIILLFVPTPFFGYPLHRTKRYTYQIRNGRDRRYE